VLGRLTTSSCCRHVDESATRLSLSLYHEHGARCRHSSTYCGRQLNTFLFQSVYVHIHEQQLTVSAVRGRCTSSLLSWASCLTFAAQYTFVTVSSCTSTVNAYYWENVPSTDGWWTSVSLRHAIETRHKRCRLMNFYTRYWRLVNSQNNPNVQL